MVKLTKIQLISMLLIGDIFSLFCMRDNVSLLSVSAFLAGISLQLVLSFPLVAVYDGGEFRSKSANFVLLAYLIFEGSMLLRMQWDTSSVIYIPGESSGSFGGRLLISALIALVCLYISSTGLRALSRASVIAAAVGIFGLSVVAVSAVFRSDLGNFARAESHRTFCEEFIRGFSVSGSFGALAVLLGLSKGSKKAGISLYFGVKAVLTSVVMMIAVLVVGGIMDVTEFPAVTAAQLSQPFSVQRIDSLFLIIFAIFGVFSIAIQSAAAAHLMERVFPNFRRFRSCLILFLIILGAFTIPRSEFFTAAAGAAVLFIIPIYQLILNKISAGKEDS